MITREKFREFLGTQIDLVYLGKDSKGNCINRVLQFCEKEGVEWLAKASNCICKCKMKGNPKGLFCEICKPSEPVKEKCQGCEEAKQWRGSVQCPIHGRKDKPKLEPLKEKCVHGNGPACMDCHRAHCGCKCQSIEQVRSSCFKIQPEPPQQTGEPRPLCNCSNFIIGKPLSSCKCPCHEPPTETKGEQMTDREWKAYRGMIQYVDSSMKNHEEEEREFRKELFSILSQQFNEHDIAYLKSRFL